VRFVLAWAGLLGVLALGLSLWWGDALSSALFWSAVAGAVLLALLAWRPRERRRVVPDASFAGILLALGISGLVAGLAFGDWQLYLGAFFAAVGLVVLAAEWRQT
jgi:Na+/H+ antiporter NhaD/arsenite permease-like protein